MGNLCCFDWEEAAVEDEDSKTFGYVIANIRIFEGSLLAFLASSIKPFIVYSSCSNGPNPATGNHPFA
jgi:hypothetical protein